MNRALDLYSKAVTCRELKLRAGIISVITNTQF